MVTFEKVSIELFHIVLLSTSVTFWTSVTNSTSVTFWTNVTKSTSVTFWTSVTKSTSVTFWTRFQLLWHFGQVSQIQLLWHFGQNLTSVTFWTKFVWLKIFTKDFQVVSTKRFHVSIKDCKLPLMISGSYQGFLVFIKDFKFLSIDYTFLSRISRFHQGFRVFFHQRFYCLTNERFCLPILNVGGQLPPNTPCLI